MQRWTAFAGTLALAGALSAAERTADDFGRDVQLAPFVVEGKDMSVSIHARSPADRRYGEAFAHEVLDVTAETLGDTTGHGLIIVGREGEPHPVSVLRRFLTLAERGQLDPAAAARAGELTALFADWKAMFPFEDELKPGEGFKVTMDMVTPALPLPLEGLSATLYRIAWAEGFDEARIEHTLRTLSSTSPTDATFANYDWVFYLPPRQAFPAVQREVLRTAVAHEKMGLFKRTALRSAVVVLKPVINGAVEASRKGLLFATVLRAQSDYARDDIMALTTAYINVLMPDMKPNGRTERQRALTAIEAQKVRNAEYAQDPFVAPPRLSDFDPAAYAKCEGDYLRGKTTIAFAKKDNAFVWQAKGRPPQIFHPAGDNLLVADNGRATLEFDVDANGAIVAAVQRRHRDRQMFLRKP